MVAGRAKNSSLTNSGRQRLHTKFTCINLVETCSKKSGGRRLSYLFLSRRARSYDSPRFPVFRFLLDDQHDRQVAFLRELVRVPSDNPPGDCAPLRCARNSCWKNWVSR